MPSIDLLLRAHPAVAWWAGLCVVGAVVLVVRRRRLPSGPAVATFALGTMVLLALVPPRRGLVPGIARTCDLGAAHLLWPWDWFRQDPRMGVVGLMVLVGAAVARRPRWLAWAVALPLVVEGGQYAVPSLARACSAPDLLHAWMGLAVGVGVGAVLHLGRRLHVTRVRAAASVLVLTTTVTAVAGWSREPAPAKPQQQTAVREVDAARGEGAPYAEMVRTAVRDLEDLSVGVASGAGLPAAGPGESWDYFWPRDGAFVAVALARVGLVDRSTALLSQAGELYLDPMYGFDARYLLTGSRVELDPRRAQVDGCGWVLWAIHETTGGVHASPSVDDLRDRCTDQLLRATGGGSHLPAPGQDYWERTTYSHLLGTSAPVAAGLRFASADYRALGQDDRAAVVGAAAAGVRSEIDRHFGPRYLRAGTSGGLDAATAMLMPPFDPDPLPGVREAWLGYQREAARPAGGLAPGSAWKDDGISWTPEVALVAYTAAAAGEDAIAEHWLGWLDRHRSPGGSLPEKVDAQGRAAGPAPLGWTSALVVLAVDARQPLHRICPPQRDGSVHNPCSGAPADLTSVVRGASALAVVTETERRRLTPGRGDTSRSAAP